MENEENKGGGRQSSDESRATATPSAAGLETIQDILFGEQMRAGNEQISKLQKESEKSLQELSNALTKQLNELDERMNAKFDSLDKQLESQQQAQTSSDQRLSGELVAAKTALTQSIDTTREQLTERQVAKELATATASSQTSKT